MQSPAGARPNQTLCVPTADWSHHRRDPKNADVNQINETSNAPAARSDSFDATECNDIGPRRSCTHDNEDADLSSDVFTPSEHEKPDHMFFLDDDDENDDKGTDEDYDAIAPYADGFHSSQFSTSEDALDTDSDPESTLSHGNFAKSLQARLDPLALLENASSGSSSSSSNNSGGNRAAAATSRPRPIPSRAVHRSHTLPTAIAAHQPVERWRRRLPVRPLVGPSSGAIMLSSSCPAAFSPRWNEIPVQPQPSQENPLPGCRVGDDSQQAQEADGICTSGSRRRRNTVCSSSHGMGTAVAGLQQPCNPSLPIPTGFVPRNRSYSESDVQRLLMREMGRELRRLSDDFAAAHGEWKRLTTVSESASEQDEFNGSGDEV